MDLPPIGVVCSEVIVSGDEVPWLNIAGKNRAAMITPTTPQITAPMIFQFHCLCSAVGNEGMNH